jgi:uncharacterized membrane protein YgcG
VRQRLPDRFPTVELTADARSAQCCAMDSTQEQDAGASLVRPCGREGGAPARNGARSRLESGPSRLRIDVSRLLGILDVLLLCLVGVHPLLAQGLPAHVGKVNDFATVLDPTQRQDLERQLTDLERATSAEIALVTVSTLEGRPIEEYATTLFNTWGLGKKGRDNGLLVLVAVQDRTMRIEVGYGLEGILPDGLAGAVMRETFLPRFREGDLVTGVLEGMARLIEIVRRHEVLTAEQRATLDQARAEAAKSWDLVWLISPSV